MTITNSITPLFNIIQNGARIRGPWNCVKLSGSVHANELCKKKKILHNHRIFYIKVHFGYNILKFEIV